MCSKVYIDNTIANISHREAVVSYIFIRWFSYMDGTIAQDNRPNQFTANKNGIPESRLKLGLQYERVLYRATPPVTRNLALCSLIHKKLGMPYWGHVLSCIFFRNSVAVQELATIYISQGLAPYFRMFNVPKFSCSIQELAQIMY